MLASVPAAHNLATALYLKVRRLAHPFTRIPQCTHHSKVLRRSLAVDLQGFASRVCRRKIVFGVMYDGISVCIRENPRNAADQLEYYISVCHVWQSQANVSIAAPPGRQSGVCLCSVQVRRDSTTEDAECRAAQKYIPANDGLRTNHGYHYQNNHGAPAAACRCVGGTSLWCPAHTLVSTVVMGRASRASARDASEVATFVRSIPTPSWHLYASLSARRHH